MGEANSLSRRKRSTCSAPEERIAEGKVKASDVQLLFVSRVKRGASKKGLEPLKSSLPARFKIGPKGFLRRGLR